MPYPYFTAGEYPVVPVSALEYRAALSRWRDEPLAEGDWQLMAAERVGEDVD